MSIRHFAIPFALLLLASQVLTACGGGGNDSPGSGSRLRETPVNAQVALPSGSAAPTVSTLRVWSSGGAGSPDAAGKVKVTVFNNGPQYTEARDASGRLVLAGFLGKSRTALNATSTAEMLAFFALGGAVVTGEAKLKVFESIHSMTGFADVVTEVESELRTDGFVTPTDPDLLAKFDAMFTAVGGGSRVANPRPNLPATTRGTIVEPTTDPSGVSIDTSVDGELKLQNVRLRRAIAWLDVISHDVDRGAGITTVSAAKSTGKDEPISIDPPKRFGGTLGTIGDLIENSTYNPTIAGPLQIPAVYDSVAGCIATNYKLSIVGPGASEGDLAKVGALREPQINKVMFEGFLLDYFLPFFTTIFIPLASDELDSFLKYSGGNAILTDAVNTVFSTSPAVGKLIYEGKYYEAVVALRDAGLLSSTFLPLMTDLFIGWVENSGSASLAGKAEQYVGEATRIFGALGNLDKGLSIAEGFIVAADFARSNQGDVLTIKSTGGKVTIVPVKPLLLTSETTSVRAQIQNKNPDAVYKYEWRVSEGFRLNDSLGKNTDNSLGGILTTSQENVAILAKDGKLGTATVTCKVSRVDGETDRGVDQASGSVTFAAVPKLTAAVPRIAKNGSTVLTASYEGPGEVEWEYSLTPTTGGTLSDTSLTESKTVTFQADTNEGSVVVTAECFLKFGAKFVSIAKATASIVVGDAAETVAYKDISVVIDSGTSFSGYAARIVPITPRPGATKYEVFRNGSLFRTFLPEDPPTAPHSNGFTNETLWERNKPANVFWVQAYFIGGRKGQVLPPTTAAGGDIEAAYALFLLSSNYPNEVYTLKVTY